MKKSKKANPLIKEKLRVDLREKYSDTFFWQWRGRNLAAMHKLQSIEEDGEESLVMAWVKDSRANTTSFPNMASVVIQSFDGGATWDHYEGSRTWPPCSRGIFKSPYGEGLIAIHGQNYFARSFDNGKTWGPRHPIPSATEHHFDGLGIPNCFSVIMTTFGRLVLVADYFLGQEGPDAQILDCTFSDDWGDTWESSRVFGPADPLPKAPGGFEEPAVVELKGGWLWMVFRTLYGELWQCISPDGGRSWNTPTPTGLASPMANCYAKGLPDSGATVLCWNHTRPGIDADFRSRASLYHPRTNLVWSISQDNCRSWSVPIVIEPRGGQYPTIHFSDDDMFIMYQSAGGEDENPWHAKGLTLVSYDKKEVDSLPAWTTEEIQPYIEKGLVAHWLALACQQPSKEPIS